jgi:hypothetical protein
MRVFKVSASLLISLLFAVAGFATSPSVSPTSLTFGAGIVGTAEATQAVTLTAGDGASMTSVVVTPVTYGSNLTEWADSTSPSTNCGGTISASGSCTITVTFTPGAAGTRTGAILITWSGGSITVGLTGTGGTTTRSFPSEIYTVPVPAKSGASISATTMVTPSAQTTYRFGYYLTQTDLGSGGTCASNTTVQVALVYQDPNAASAQTVNLGLHTIAGAGTVGVAPWTSGPTSMTFVSAASVPVQFQTTFSGGNCNTQPKVQLYPVLMAF